MKIIGWNVNGIRAVMSKGFKEFVKSEDPDIVCVQEAKMQEGQADIDIDGYTHYLNSAERKGYSGTLVYTKIQPKNVVFGISGKHLDEGRTITLEFDNFYLVNGYSPNAQDELKRINYRVEYENDLREYLIALKSKKPVIYTGDMNVARTEKDVKLESGDYDSLEMCAGYSFSERTKMEELLSSGFVDTFRQLYPEKIEYSWWSYKFMARQRNIGWRIDYFLVSEDIFGLVQDSQILTKVYGSDHAPVCLTINL